MKSRECKDDKTHKCSAVIINIGAAEAVRVPVKTATQSKQTEQHRAEQCLCDDALTVYKTGQNTRRQKASGEGDDDESEDATERENESGSGSGSATEKEMPSRQDENCTG